MFSLQQACDIVVRTHRCIWKGTRTVWITGEEFPTHYLIAYCMSFDSPGYADWAMKMVVDKLNGTSYELPKRMDGKGPLTLEDYPADRERLRQFTLADLWQMEMESYPKKRR